MDDIKNLAAPIKKFTQNSQMFLNKCEKPNRKGICRTNRFVAVSCF